MIEATSSDEKGLAFIGRRMLGVEGWMTRSLGVKSDERIKPREASVHKFA